MLKVRVGQVCVTGRYRENNEDNCLVDADGRFFLVADGMGGQSAGEKASELAVHLVPQKLSQLLNFTDDPAEKVKQVITKAVEHANGEIIALGTVDPDFHNMGTTLVLLVRVGDMFYIAGVGDSRAYMYRGGKLQQLTTDHSLTQALLDAGTISQEDAVNHRYRNVLYRYLGTKDGGNGVEVTPIQPQPGDRFILCSDGVTDGIDHERIVAELDQHADPQPAAEAIVAAAEAGGSRDNITCLVLNVE